MEAKIGRKAKEKGGNPNARQRLAATQQAPRSLDFEGRAPRCQTFQICETFYFGKILASKFLKFYILGGVLQPKSMKISRRKVEFTTNKRGISLRVFGGS